MYVFQSACLESLGLGSNYLATKPLEEEDFVVDNGFVIYTLLHTAAVAVGGPAIAWRLPLHTEEVAVPADAESSHTPVAVACICSLRPARSSHALFNPPILVEIQVAFNNGTRSNKKRPRISQAPFRFCSQHSSFGFLISVQRWNERSGGEPSSQIDGPFPEERTSPFGGHRHDTTRHESKRSGNTDEVFRAIEEQQAGIELTNWRRRWRVDGDEYLKSEAEIPDY